MKNTILGRTAEHKLAKLREWIQQQPSSAPSYLKETTPNRQYLQTATLVTSLTCIGTSHPNPILIPIPIPTLTF